jgi:signal transduction histidine kinase
MSVARRVTPVRSRSLLIPLLCGLFTLGGATVLVEQYRAADTLTQVFYGAVGIALPVLVAGASLYLVRTSLHEDDVPTVAAWMAGSVLALWALYVWWLLPDLLSGDSPFEYLELFVLYGNLGLAIGLVAGLNRARAHQNRRLVERTVAQQNALEFINHLLRHNVRNGLQVIEGYAGFTHPHVDSDGRRYVTRIEDRTAHMTDLIDDVRVLMRTLTGEDTLRPVDCAAILDREVVVVRAAYPDATFAFESRPDELWVTANSALGAVFENLLSNAVLHSDTGAPTVTISTERAGDRIVVRVDDDGPGVPDGCKQRYLDQGAGRPESTGEGLGLYLVETLCRAYGGGVRIEDNDPRGASFVVELPAARPA